MDLNKLIKIGSTYERLVAIARRLTLPSEALRQGKIAGEKIATAIETEANAARKAGAITDEALTAAKSDAQVWRASPVTLNRLTGNIQSAPGARQLNFPMTPYGVSASLPSLQPLLGVKLFKANLDPKTLENTYKEFELTRRALLPHVSDQFGQARALRNTYIDDAASRGVQPLNLEWSLLVSRDKANKAAPAVTATVNRGVQALYVMTERFLP